MRIEPPMVSIIVPVRNEANNISSCLARIIEQENCPEQMEIFVVDGLSTDGTREMIQDFEKHHPNLKRLDNPGRIVPTGMNIALRQARGDIIIRVDGHCEIAPDYVSSCVRHLRQDGVDGVGGSVETIGESPLAETIAIAMSSKFGVGGSPFRTVTGKSMLADSIPFPAYTRSIIQKAGLYDEELVRNQDDEYNYRLRGLGAKLLLASDVHSRYYSRGSLGKLWKQYFQYGFWKVRVLQKHPRQMRPRQFVPPLFALSLLLTLLIAILSPVLRLPFAILITAYLAATLAASIYTAGKRGWRHLLLLPLVFAIIHLSYGFGFLLGLLKFWNRWGDKHGKVPQWTASSREYGSTTD